MVALSLHIPRDPGREIYMTAQLDKYCAIVT